MYLHKAQCGEKQTALPHMGKIPFSLSTDVVLTEAQHFLTSRVKAKERIV